MDLMISRYSFQGLTIWAVRQHFVGILDLLEGHEITAMLEGIPNRWVPSEGFPEAFAIHGNSWQFMAIAAQFMYNSWQLQHN